MERLATNEIKENDDGTITIFLINGGESVVDKNSWDRACNYRWYKMPGANTTQYAQATRTIGGFSKTYSLHRICTSAPKGMDVDHIDRDGLNNRLSNLRICTRAENLHNGKIKRTNTSGFKGIRKNHGKWEARMRINGKNKYLGIFAKKEDAAEAYKKYAIKKHGEFYRER